MNESAVEHTKWLHINEPCIIIFYMFEMRTLCTEPLENVDNQISTSSVLQCKLSLEIFQHFTFVEICELF